LWSFSVTLLAIIKQITTTTTNPHHLVVQFVSGGSLVAGIYVSIIPAFLSPPSINPGHHKNPYLQAPDDQVSSQNHPVSSGPDIEGTIKTPACRPLWNILIFHLFPYYYYYFTAVKASKTSPKITQNIFSHHLGCYLISCRWCS
jgi:hypothetical protein